MQITDHLIYDPTECKLHCVTDPATGARRIVAFVPKTVAATITTDPAGGGLSRVVYNVTEWEEVELAKLDPLAP